MAIIQRPIEATADNTCDDDHSFGDHHVLSVASGIQEIACVENRLRLVGRLLEETVLLQLLPSRHGLLPVQLAHERVRRIAQHVRSDNRISVGEVLLIANHVRTAKVGGGVDLLRIASVEHIAGVELRECGGKAAEAVVNHHHLLTVPFLLLLQELRSSAVLASNPLLKLRLLLLHSLKFFRHLLRAVAEKYGGPLLSLQWRREWEASEEIIFVFDVFVFAAELIASLVTLGLDVVLGEENVIFVHGGDDA